MIALDRLGIDLFPPIDFPVITVTTIYPGVTPEEVENLISKPIEEQVSTISGLKRLSSRNMEGISIVIAEFTLETDVKYAEQKMREKVSLARNQLPQDLLDEPIIRQFDFTDVPVVTIALMAELAPTELYDLAKEQIKPLIEQVNGVGEVRITGGTRREVQIELDRDKLNYYEISATKVANQIRNTGANVPIGKFDEQGKSTVFRTIGEFTSIEQIKKTIINFPGDVASSVSLDTLGTVSDGSADVQTMAYLYFPVEEKKERGFFEKIFSGKKNEILKKQMYPCLIMDVFKQSGSNSVAVTDGIMKRMDKINAIIKASKGKPKLEIVYDTAKYIRRNVDDVKETMVIGIILAVIVVYLFLGNIRSTIITGIAIPNSLFGAFILMYIMGFTINIMSLLALSLTVGLLVDDAIVVRENIFRKLESGLHPMVAAQKGTTEVMLAVIATTLTIIAVFFPIGFLEGIVGRFFKQFGLTVVFAMCVSLFDALTVAPLLSGYFAGSGHKSNNFIVRSFDKFQDWLDSYYGKMIAFSLERPLLIIMLSTMVFVVSCGTFSFVKKTFQPDPDEGEFLVNLEMPPGTSLGGTHDIVKKIIEKIKNVPELHHMNIQVGNEQGEYNIASMGIFMVPAEDRVKDTNQLKMDIRGLLKEFAIARPTVDNYSRVGGGSSNKPFVLNLNGEDLDVLYNYSEKVIAELKKIPDLTEITTSYQSGKPEFQVILDDKKMQMLGVMNKQAGMELRYYVEGGVVGKFHDKGLEYDVRMRLKPSQRDIRQSFKDIKIPNLQQPSRMISLSSIAKGVDKMGPSKITRQDRSRVIQVFANISPGGAVGPAIDQTKNIVTKILPLPDGVSYAFVGMADSFQDMIKNIVTAFFLSLIFIYLILASLYESFITPLTIMLALPPALSGAVLALFITGMNMDMFSMIGIIMLLGLVTKNSILLVDFAAEGVRAGMSRKDAITRAGLIRLRPILMTTFAMLAGTLPVALGVGAAAKYRAGMGVAIIGGLVISTIITLLMVPAAFEYIDIFREFIESKFRPKADVNTVTSATKEEVKVTEQVANRKVKKTISK
jgi:HAE1 family hydrophobic/amphiphilic exporter-1